MTYKILVLRNEKLNLLPSFEKDVEYFKEKGINTSFDFKEVNIPVAIEVYKTVEGFNPVTGVKGMVKYFGVTHSVKEKCRALVKEGEYQAVVFSYDMDSVKHLLPKDGIITSWCNFQPLYQGTEFIQLAANQYFIDQDKAWKAISHEKLHAMPATLNRKGYPVLDEMDMTRMPNGQIIPAYKNDDPYAPDGNYAQTLENMKPYISKLYPEAKKGLNHFTSEEVKGLKPDFAEKLDLGREYSDGMPWVLTSTLRTPEKNKAVGGSPTSAHLDGTGADVRARNWVEVGKIVDGARKAGITGITVYKESPHVHLDMKPYRLEVK